MKKILLFVAAFAVLSMCANAQVVKKFTEILTTENAPVAGTVWAVDGCSMMFYDNPSADGVKANGPITVGAETFEFSLQGVNNPKPWQYQPIGGSAMTLFDVTQAGSLTIVAAISKTKKTYLAVTPIVADKADANYCYVLCGEAGVTDYLYADETQFAAGATLIEGINGLPAGELWPADTIAGSSWIFKAITFAAEANKCYNLFCTGSKLSMFGYIFNAGAGINNTSLDKKVISSRYYSITGTEYRNVGEGSVPGLYISKNFMSDGTIETTKVLIK